MRSGICAGVLIFVFSLTCAADEEPIYESLSSIDIGRVFTTQAQRDALDARRRTSVQKDSAASAAPSGAAPRSAGPEAAGFIIARQGTVKVWKDGDFIELRDSALRPVSLPGGSRIVRHLPVEDSAEAADPDAADSEPDDDGT